MGIALSSWFSIFKKKDARIVMVGLDAAGKTTILYQLKLNKVVPTIPTIGFNVERIEYKNLKMTIWDVCGGGLRQLWRHYYEHSNGIIFVIDSTDKARLPMVKDELHKMMAEPALADAKLLVLANKQDLAFALTTSDLVGALELLPLRRPWFVQACSAATGDGIAAGLDWLASNI